MRGQKGQEDQRIFRVLMNSKELQPGCQGRFRGVDDFNPERGELLVQSRWRPDSNSFRRDFPHMDIGPVVADIVKPPLAESLGKKARFVPPGDVCRGAGAEPASEKSKMVRDSGHETFVASGCE